YGVFKGTSPRKPIWSQSIGDVIGKCVNHVVGTGRKACVRYVPLCTGGSGEIRTRDQQYLGAMLALFNQLSSWDSNNLAINSGDNRSASLDC
ncbi:hypothetical protein, partial [Polynucleobacter sp. AP-Melu-500A-A1]|uniref:hypothetical protein n=1 Tax=Polynucleobacter sp. AP-Melu-500A-A1 TaxID=2576929 RepID=UPI001C0D59A8